MENRIIRSKKETSDLDIALPDKTGDEEYLKIINDTVAKLIDREKPDFIFYLSGVDILDSDKLGKLGCSINGCKKEMKSYCLFAASLKFLSNAVWAEAIHRK